MLTSPWKNSPLEESNYTVEVLLSVLYLFCTESDHNIPDVLEVDIKDEVTATDTDSYSTVCASHSTIQLSSCDDDSTDTDTNTDNSYCQSTTRQSAFVCKACGQKFVSSSSLDKHLPVHTADHSYTSHSTSRLSSSRDDVPVDDYCMENVQKVDIENKLSARITDSNSNSGCSEDDSMAAGTDSDSDYCPGATRQLTFTCKACRQTFQHSSSLNRHSLRVGHYSCDVCSKKFASSHGLRSHMLVHGMECSYPCNICNKVYASSNSLKKHMRSHSGERPFSCCVCNQGFMQSSTLNQHMHTHGSRQFVEEVLATNTDNCSNMTSAPQSTTQFPSCNDDDSTDTDTNSNNNYCQSTTRQSTFMCKACGQKFVNSSSLDKHLLIHTADHSYSCNAHISSDLSAYTCVHRGERTFLCTFCKKQFTNLSSLNVHLLFHCGQRPFSCYVCKQVFTQLGSLNQNMQNHTGKLPFECDVCKMQFKRTYSLEQHMRTHTLERPLECYVCKQRFSLSDSLKSHMLTHSGMKPVLCPICQRTFTSSSMPRKDNKSYTCDVCCKRFSSFCSLKYHMHRHTGERLFTCTICQRGFSHPSRLNSHMSMHPEEKAF